MWDAKWNAGGGIFDQNAVVWKDLVGKNNLILNGSFGTDYFEGEGSTQFDIYKDTCNAQSMTIDFCAEVSNAQSRFFTAGSNNNSWYSADGVPYKWLRIHDGLNSLQGFMPTIGERLHASIVIGITAKRIWLNGVDVGNVSYTASIPVTSTDFKIGWNVASWK